MNHNNRFAVSLLLLIALLAGIVFPPTLSALIPRPSWIVPAGYNAHDYDKCAAFLEQTDENGVKNGARIDADYDANDPSTWVSYDGFGNAFEHFRWSDVDGELRLWRLDVAHLSAVGVLDVADCTALDYIEATGDRLDAIVLDGCTALTELYCDGNGLGALDVSPCSALTQLWCDGNALTELDLSNNPALSILDCNRNALIELDLSNNPALSELYCESNLLSELDLAANPELSWLWCPRNRLTSINVSENAKLRRLYCEDNPLASLDLSCNPRLEVLDCAYNSFNELDVSNCSELRELHAIGTPFSRLVLNGRLGPRIIRAEGGGVFDFHYSIPYGEGFASASGDGFIGWFNADGALLSSGANYHFFETNEAELIARFYVEHDPIPGDVDGDGSVSSADAVLALRASMGLFMPNEQQKLAADMDGDGSITVSDAVLVLRAALGV